MVSVTSTFEWIQGPNNAGSARAPPNPGLSSTPNVGLSRLVMMRKRVKYEEKSDFIRILMVP